MKKEDELKSMLEDAADQLRLAHSALVTLTDLVRDQHSVLIPFYETLIESIEYRVSKIQNTLK